MKEIQLNKGLVVLVDDEDFDLLNQWKWFAFKGRNTYYAIRNNWHKGKNKCVYMHRQILGLQSGDKRHADHKDHNGLNNCRNNIRLCTNSENRYNMVHRSGGTSGYRGVDFIAKWNKWRARVNKDKKVYDLGLYESEQMAAVAYNQKAKELFGEFANLNVLS